MMSCYVKSVSKAALEWVRVDPSLNTLNKKDVAYVMFTILMLNNFKPPSPRLPYSSREDWMTRTFGEEAQCVGRFVEVIGVE